MNIVKKILILIVGIIIFLFSVYYGLLFYYSKLTVNKPHTVVADKLQISFAKAVSEINIRVVDLCPTYSSLLSIDKFCSIYANSRFYLDEAIAFLISSTPTEQEKSIAILSMKNLDENDYIVFFEKCTDLYIKDLISDQNSAISAFIAEDCFNNSDVIVKNFYKPKVRKCLKKIKAKTPEAKQMVNLILSGRYWLFRAAGKVDYGEIKNDNIVCSWLLYYTYRTVMFIHNTFHIFPYEDSYKTK